MTIRRLRFGWQTIGNGMRFAYRCNAVTVMNRYYCIFDLTCSRCNTDTCCQLHRRSHNTTILHTGLTLAMRTHSGVGEPYLRFHRQSPLASTPPGMPGTHPHQYFGWGDVNGNIPPNIITYFRAQQTNINRPPAPLKPISFGYKMPPIRFSQAGGQWAHML